MSGLEDLTAREIVAGTRRREIAAAEVVAALLDRIARLDPLLHAWVVVDAERALAAARALDAAAARGDLRPLHGLPVGVKDIIDVAGLPTAAGFAPFRARVAERDAAIVARLRALGAVVLGKTETTQFAHADPAPTRNPWNLERSPGGSSAGSGAAVAARMTPLALGTQTAGSVLRPAAFCGVVGLKPTFNWFSRAGVLPLGWSLDHLGLLTRAVDDAALVFGALTGAEVDAAVDRPPRVALLVDLLGRADPAVAAHARAVAGGLAAAGAEVVEARLPVDLDLVFAVQHVIMQVETAAVHAALYAERPGAYAPLIRREIEVGQLIPAAYDLAARRLRRRIGRAVDGLLAGVDAALLPTVTTVAPGMETTGDRTFQALWTMLGVPAISLPTGLDADGLPLATQLVARRGEDRRLLAVAGWCAAVVGTIGPPAIDG